MKPEDRVEKAIREEFRFAAGSDLRDRMLTRALDAHEEGRKSRPVPAGPAIGKTTRRRPIARFAVAAVIVAGLLIGHGLVHNGKEVAIEPSGHARIETLNLVSLNAAYRQGGMEALEQQYRKTFIDSQSRPARLSVERLLTELAENGES